MTIEETRLDLAVRMADRAMRSDPEALLDERLEAFAAIYRAMLPLHAGDDDWTAETLAAACGLVEDAYPRGGDPHTVAREVARAHHFVTSLATAPPPDRRTKPRRDA